MAILALIGTAADGLRLRSVVWRSEAGGSCVACFAGVVLGDPVSEYPARGRSSACPQAAGARPATDSTASRESPVTRQISSSGQPALRASSTATSNARRAVT